MMRLLVLVVALAGLAAQESPYDPDGHLKSEHQIPAGDYCKKVGVPITPREVHAHSCDCAYACVVDDNGTVHESDGEKNPHCLSYCSKDGRRCTCHVEEPCDPKGGALMDMDGHVIAVKARTR